MRFIYLLVFIIVVQTGSAQGSGNVLTYNGSNQYVDLGTNVASNCRTVEFWFKSPVLVNSSSPNFQTLVGRDFNNGSGLNTNEFGFYIAPASWPNSQGNISFYRRVGGASYFIVSNSNSWQANVWYHVAGVIDPVLGMQLYINGVLQNNTDPTVQPIQPATDMIAIATWGFWGANTGNRFYNGDLDELRFWTTTRTQTQIRDNMCRKINPTQAGLRGYYRFDNTAGNTLTDLTGNGYNGTLNGFATNGWHYSGAPIGDTATNVYPATWAAQSLALQYAAGDVFTVSNVTTNPAGAHIYRVNSLPNVTTGLQFPLAEYYGVFLTSTTGNYDIAENFSAYTSSCSGGCLTLAARTHDAILAWTTISPNSSSNCVLTKLNESSVGVSYRAEYILSVGTTSLSVSTTSVSCNGGTDGTATANATGGINPYSYTWTPSGSNSATLTAGAGNYTVTVANAAGCAQSLSTQIIEPPPITIVVNNITICSGQTASLTAQAVGATEPCTYTWNGIYTGQTYTVASGTSSVYSVAVADANGCLAPPATVSLTVLPPLHVTLGDTIICGGNSVAVTANANGGNGNYVFNWVPGNLSGNSVSVSPQSTTVYTVTVSDGCTVTNASDTGVVVISNNIQLLALPTSSSGCEPLCVTFTVSNNPTITSWIWNFGDSTTANTQNPYHCYNTAGNFNISLTYGTAQGCKKTITGNNLIKVFNSPEADFTASNFNTDILNPTVNFTNQSQGAIAYSWSYGDGDSSNGINPSHIYSSVGDFAVSLMAINSLGCTDTATYIVYIKEMYTFYAPSCFTPNGDYLNEHFLPEGTGWDNTTFIMQIFDRWGNNVFTSKDYSKGWDGKKSASQDIVQEDVYVWKVSLNDNNGKQHEYHGIVSLIK